MFFLNFIFVFFILFLFSFMIFFLGWLKSIFYNEKSSSFECGFSSFSSSGISFSLPFFIISILFILFDVEIILVIFPCFNFGILSMNLPVYLLIFFLIFILTFYELKKGVISWLSSF